jgi:hypothetical protein
MADIPDINPIKHIWPTRPDDKNPSRKERRPGDAPDGERKDQKPSNKDRQGGDSDGHIDEYV